MITFTLQNGVVATLRTSGTEPKIKYYTEFCAAPGKRSAGSNVVCSLFRVLVLRVVNVHMCDLCFSDVSSLEEELRKITTALLDDFLEPERNNLIRRCV